MAELSIMLAIFSIDVGKLIGHNNYVRPGKTTPSAKLVTGSFQQAVEI